MASYAHQSAAAIAATKFNYKSLDKETRNVVQDATREIRDRMRRAVQAVAEIGDHLAMVKDRLGHGQWEQWLAAEFDWTAKTARRYMRAAEFVKTNNLSDLNIAPSALYLLSSPSTSDEIRGAFVGQARAGDAVTHAAVKRSMALAGEGENGAHGHQIDDSDLPSIDVTPRDGLTPGDWFLVESGRLMRIRAMESWRGAGFPSWEDYCRKVAYGTPEEVDFVIQFALELARGIVAADAAEVQNA